MRTEARTISIYRTKGTVPVTQGWPDFHLTIPRTNFSFPLVLVEGWNAGIVKSVADVCALSRGERNRFKLILSPPSYSDPITNTMDRTSHWFRDLVFMAESTNPIR